MTDAWRKVLFAVIIVVLSFATSRWLAYDFLSISYFAPMEKAGDFEVSDFYNIVADGRAVSQLDSNIVIVSVDGCSREQIAEVVEQVDFCEPRAVGLDIFFDWPGDDDSFLIETVSECAHLVLPVSVSYSTDTGIAGRTEGSFFYEHLPSDRVYGFVNLAGDSNRSVIREFRPFFLRETDTLCSFAVEITRMADPVAVATLFKRNNDHELINYPSREFDVIYPEEVLVSQEILRDKIVLIGTLNDLSDMHITPVSAQMPGILIHAHTVATILNGDYIKESGNAVDWTIAVVLCFIIVLINVFLWPYDAGALLVRIFQIGMLYLIVWCGCRIFISYHVSVNFSFPLLMVGLGLLVTDIWFGILGGLKWLSVKFGKFLCQKNKNDEGYSNNAVI